MFNNIINMHLLFTNKTKEYVIINIIIIVMFKVKLYDYIRYLNVKNAYKLIYKRFVVFFYNFLFK